MEKWIVPARGNGDRLFPPVAPDLYAAAGEGTEQSPDRRAARRLLAAAPARLSLGRRHGWRLGPADQVLRLLYLHRLGLEAELQGRGRRADGYWRREAEALRRLPEGHVAWAALAARFAPEGAAASSVDPARLRRRLIDEMLIDTHAAFYNGYIRSVKEPAPEDRAFVHADHLLALAAAAGPYDAALRTLVRPAVVQRMGRYRAAKRYDEGIAVAAALARQFPDEEAFQDQLVETHLDAAIAAAPRVDSGEQCRLQANALAGRIRALEGLAEEYPYCVLAYEALGLLHHLRAVKLANGNRPSQALVALAKASTYKPGWAEAAQSEHQIERSLEQLTAQVRLLEARLGYNYGSRTLVTLTGEGQALREEARSGREPRDAYLKSEHRKSVRAARKRAADRSLWLRMGLAPPADRWDERAAALDEGTDLLLAKKPADGAGLMLAWLNVLAERPDLNLGDLDAAAVCLFFLKKTEPEGTGAAGPPEGAPVLTPAARRGIDAEPFDFWLLSRRDPALKGLAAAALILLLVAGVLTAVEWLRLRDRDAAFEQLGTAAANADDQTGLAAAGRFLAAAPLLGQDDRTAQVREAQDDFSEFSNRRLRDRAYGRLVEAAARRDENAVAEAADAYLKAPPLKGDDPRTFGVVKQASEAKEWPNRRERDRSYEQLAAAVAKADDPAVEQAAKAFLAAPPLAGGPDPRTPEVEKWDAEAKRWPDRRDRDRAVQDLLDAAAKEDARGALGAAAAFRKKLPDGVLDPRADRVREWADEAKEWPNRRLRDAAYADLEKASAAADGEATLGAAERFLQAAPVHSADPRAGRVLALYNDAFTRWFARLTANLDDGARQRIERYRTLTALVSQP